MMMNHEKSRKSLGSSAWMSKHGNVTLTHIHHLGIFPSQNSNELSKKLVGDEIIQMK